MNKRTHILLFGQECTSLIVTVIHFSSTQVLLDHRGIIVFIKGASRALCYHPIFPFFPLCSGAASGRARNNCSTFRTFLHFLSFFSIRERTMHHVCIPGEVLFFYGAVVRIA